MDNEMPLWKAIPIVLAVLALIGVAFWQADVRDDPTLFWATVLLCVALVPPCVSGWRKGRRRR